MIKKKGRKPKSYYDNLNNQTTLDDTPLTRKDKIERK